MTPEQNQIISRAAAIYAEATGMTAAGARESLGNPELLSQVAAGLRSIAGGTSPLADEMDSISKPPPSGGDLIVKVV